MLFDVPEPSDDAGSRQRATAFQRTVVEDTIRPAIEAVYDADSALGILPKHENGEIDWVEALRDGTIKPRKTLPGGPDPGYVDGFGFDFLLPGPDKMFDALFPHSSHVTVLACNTCHPDIVPYRNTPISMEEVNNGESCGVCHGKVAFSVGACGRCHLGMPPGEFTASLEPDIVFTRVGAEDQPTAGAFPPAQFAHWVHRIRYRCSACHPATFAMRAGTDTLTMAAMGNGEQCGACHDGTAAFPLTECNACHPPASSAQVP